MNIRDTRPLEEVLREENEEKKDVPTLKLYDSEGRICHNLLYAARGYYVYKNRKEPIFN